MSDVDFGLAPPERLDVTFAYLGGGLTEVTREADDAWVAKARDHLEELTEAIDSARFDPTPGSWCHGCDFLQFCEAGQREVTE